MKELFDAWRSVDRNKIAALASVIPGAGHLYKRHYLSGAGLLTAGNLFIAFVSLWLAFATLGLSLILVPAIWIAAVGYSAYYAEDRHGAHPYLHISRLMPTPNPYRRK